ncbi:MULTISPECIES: hypothetical protein [Bacillaceae]|uniref:Uncharacterized protein n=1 Tax=Evansella alkalicola TaxID=745819 RepID=A0ABS6JV87_9BACI|nr:MULTISPECIES: hypothetical protein [Bacillaceae]MBU9722464.1 hypothetical protein [Bacillus alkalicola]
MSNRRQPTAVRFLSDDDINKNLNRLDNENILKDKNFNFNIADVTDSGNSYVDVYVDAEAVAKARQAQRRRQRQTDIL